MTLAFKQRLALYDPNMNDLKSRAKFGIIPSYLHADHIAELWAEGTEFSKEAYLSIIKEQIEDGQLPCMTIGQWTKNRKSRTRCGLLRNEICLFFQHFIFISVLKAGNSPFTF